jgi:hypothetical protein
MCGAIPLLLRTAAWCGVQAQWQLYTYIYQLLPICNVFCVKCRNEMQYLCLKRGSCCNIAIFRTNCQSPDITWHVAPDLSINATSNGGNAKCQQGHRDRSLTGDIWSHYLTDAAALVIKAVGSTQGQLSHASVCCTHWNWTWAFGHLRVHVLTRIFIRFNYSVIWRSAIW